VDCTADGKELCEEVGVTGYPTIKYGDPSDKKALKVYEGGRTLDDLKKFAEENLGPVCAPATMDACDAEEKALLEGFLKRPSADLLAEAKKLDKGFAATLKKLDKKAGKLKEKRTEYRDDLEEHGKSKPKKGKEAAHKAKTDKFEATKVKLNGEQEALDKEKATLKADTAKSGVKLMKLAAGANAGRTDL